jgi:thiosulfate/3-mercaptopyruvate sulfurtransferase
VASTRAEVLITATDLAKRIDNGRPVTILDVRWQLSEPDGRAAHRHGHIPGAVYVSLEDELTDYTVTGRGRHPLPSGRSVEAAARRWGVRRRVPVVAYDDWNRAGSARAWWVLTAAGRTDVRILDGGLGAWVAAGVYCGSGITATVTVAALAAVGVDAALFPGSWSEWISDPARPVARGQHG